MQQVIAIECNGAPNSNRQAHILQTGLDFCSVAEQLPKPTVI
jgi:hypothetical protein